MTHIKTYLWKEWHQNRSLALGAVGVVLGISCVSLLVDAAEAGQGLVALGGPVLAMVLGVHALGREQGNIDAFWRSRPVSMLTWVLCKYVMGLLILGGVLGVLVLIQVLLHRFAGLPGRHLNGLAALALVYGWIVLGMYSAAFVLGQWVRGVMHALILSVGACALILLVPVIVPWLNPWSLLFVTRVGPNALQTSGYAAFALGMVAFSSATVWLCWLLVKKRVQVDVDQRTIAWSTVILLLVLGAAALFPIGTNLTPEQIVTLPVKQDARVVAMAAQDNQVLVLLSDGPQRNSSRDRRFGLVRVEVSAGEAPGGETNVSMAEPLWFLASRGQDHYYTMHDLVWSADNPSLAYVLARKRRLVNRKEYDASDRLMTLRLDNALTPIVDNQDLTPHLSEGYSILSMSLEQSRLYVYEQQEQNRLLAFSVDTPERPTLASNRIVPPLGFNGPGFPGDRVKPTQDQINTVSGLEDPLRTTYDLTRRYSWPWSQTREGHILAFTEDWVLTLFEKDRIEGERIALKPISQRPRTAVQKLLRLGYTTVIDSLGRWVVCADGLGVTVHRVGDNNEIHRVGHYAAGQGFGDLAILPDQRVILGNDRLHILKLP